MKRTFAMTAVACSMAIGLAAQTPATGGAQSGYPSDAKNKVSVTGCLEKAGPAASATGGASGATADTAKFVLKNATSGGAASGSATAASGAAAGTGGTAAPGASASAGAAGTTYRLQGDDAKLTPHVGHKVTIMGTVDTAGSGSTGAAKSTASAGGPMLKFDSLKMVAASCTP